MAIRAQECADALKGIEDPHNFVRMGKSAIGNYERLKKSHRQLIITLETLLRDNSEINREMARKVIMKAKGK